MTMDYSTYTYLKVEVDKDGVATVTLNRPEVLNAINRAGIVELHDRIFQDLAEDDAVKAIVLTGAGRGFCAGFDVKIFDKEATARATQPGGAAANLTRDTFGGIKLLNAMLDLEKPIIAAVNGAAVGLGATIAVFCDIIIAAETARFGDTHISVGVVPGDGGTIMWPLLIGPAKAKELLMTGDIIDAKEAERIGLVNRVVPLEDLMPTAKALARRLAKGPTLAIAWTKRSVNKRIKQDINLLMDGCLLSERITFQTEDHREAARAFAEKRQPKFKGR